MLSTTHPFSLCMTTVLPTHEDDRCVCTRNGHGADRSCRPRPRSTLKIVQDIVATLRARGMRMTPQRRRVIAAVEELGHATPDALAATVARDGGAALPLSTIYRNLEALEDLGVVTHTHLDHRSPTYHLA